MLMVILITSDGTAKLVDFGLARAETQPSITITDEFLGTPSYVSPEQIRKPDIVDCRSDVFSLAATYYECLTLHLPFGGDTVDETLTHVILHEAVPPKKYSPRLSTDFNTVLLHALEKSPEDRYQSAADFAADIENMLEFKPITVKRPSITSRFYKTLRRTPLKIVAVGLSILALALSYFLFLNYIQTDIIEVYRKDTQIDPNNVSSRMDLAHIYLRLKRYNEVIGACKAAVKIDPNSIGVYNHLGFAYCRLGRWQEAKESFEQAIKINPDDVEACGNLGSVYWQLGQYEKAVEAFKQAIKLKPDNAIAYNDWGCVLGYLAKKEEGSVRQQLLAEKKEKCLKAESIKLGSGAYGLACIAALENDKTLSRKWLKICEQANTLPSHKHAESDSELDSVRNDLWFKQIHWSEDQK